MRGSVVILVFAGIVIGGCGPNPEVTPVAQPDTLITGRIAGVRPNPGDPSAAEIDVAVSVPEVLQESLRREGRPVPAMPKDYKIVARVTRDTVCVAASRAVDLAALRVGEEIVVLPVPGTTAMIGASRLDAEAAEVIQFQTYRASRMARSLDTVPAGFDPVGSAERINSPGPETTPLALAGGRVLYFAAGLASVQLASGAVTVGAVRPGMKTGAGSLAPWAVGGTRPYRSEWRDGRWSAPTLIEFLALPMDATVRITWVNESETSCLVDVVENGDTHKLLASERSDAKSAWGALSPVGLATGASTGDGQRFGTSSKALVWTVFSPEGSDLWLSLDGKAGQALDPRINTLGPEWAPRVGSKHELYFCRAGRQLLYQRGAVNEVRLPGAQLRPLLEAAPQAGGTLLFFRVPRYVFGEADSDIAVATRTPDGWSDAIAIDDWRPAQ